MFDYNRHFEPDRVDGYHWTAAGKRRFLEVLADSGSVERARGAVSKSRQAVHALRRKEKGQIFATGWDAALMIARDCVGDRLLEHAMTGVEDIGWRHPQSGRLMWRRSDALLGPGMGMALLGRLDRALAKIAADVARYDAAAKAAADWEAFLDRVAPAQPEICQLARNSANSNLPKGGFEAAIEARNYHRHGDVSDRQIATAKPRA